MSQNTLFEVNSLTVKNDANKYATDFQTPINVCEYMASMVPASSKKVLEPTPGIGNLKGELLKKVLM